MSLLAVDDLSISIGNITLLEGITFSVDKGQVLGIVGESGSGKSLTALTVMGLLPLSRGRIRSGSMVFDGVELTTLPERAYRKLRGSRIAFIAQNPMTSLDPVMSVGDQIDQVLRLHLKMTRKAARLRSIELLSQLRIPEAFEVCKLYPHQLSGGMKQRIVIAMALAADPDLIIADEPTTALDVTVQAQIIELLVQLVRQRDMALMLITHDMGVIAHACDQVVVLYAGRVAESNETGAIFRHQSHPYTEALIRCIPRAGMAPGSLKGIPGSVPSVAAYKSGCRFHPRCPIATDVCRTETPQIRTTADGGYVACHFTAGVQE
ncbi:oligopeptide/dipeptide ABC transporter ATP-binding protein [Mycoplana sp. BE70]|uniref:ABC transporter ATP-binding protein n=1 Tax=Mycoplana sp. BE70 TaxID=2817775 RepID=UPI00285423D5|nr:ABC transporter ATP-binding protein [Mycoplana sp. BE70]MDR6759287.1 oligopeptide/dipeptide ABC transporter ATP-binding protein [Mycoplana sp. BE70]